MFSTLQGCSEKRDVPLMPTKISAQERGGERGCCRWVNTRHGCTVTFHTGVSSQPSMPGCFPQTAPAPGEHWAALGGPHWATAGAGQGPSSNGGSRTGSLRGDLPQYLHGGGRGGLKAGSAHPRPPPQGILPLPSPAGQGAKGGLGHWPRLCTKGSTVGCLPLRFLQWLIRGDITAITHISFSPGYF